MQTVYMQLAAEGIGVVEVALQAGYESAKLRLTRQPPHSFDSMIIQQHLTENLHCMDDQLCRNAVKPECSPLNEVKAPAHKAHLMA